MLAGVRMRVCVYSGVCGEDRGGDHRMVRVCVRVYSDKVGQEGSRTPSGSPGSERSSQNQAK